MFVLRPQRQDAELARLRAVQERAVFKLYDRGLTMEEISDTLYLPPARLPLLLGNRMIGEEAFSAWMIVLDRYFGNIDDSLMLERLLAMTFHTYSRPPGSWYESSPDGSGKVLMRFYQDGYISKKEYQELLDHASFVVITRPDI